MQEKLLNTLEKAVFDECLDITTDVITIYNATCILRCIRDKIHAADPSDQITPDAIEGVLYLLEDCQDAMEERANRILQLYKKEGEQHA